jgi:hypothetical protein
MTGGDACAIAVVSPLTDMNNSIVGYNLYIEHGAGDALLYDLRVSVFAIHETGYVTLFQEVYENQFPILTPQTGPIRLGDDPVSGFGNFESIGVMIRQRNGILRQIIKLIKRDEDYLVAEKAIFTTNDGKERVVRNSLPQQFRFAGRDTWSFENFDTAKGYPFPVSGENASKTR